MKIITAMAIVLALTLVGCSVFNIGDGKRSEYIVKYSVDISEFSDILGDIGIDIDSSVELLPVIKVNCSFAMVTIIYHLQ